MFTRDELTRAVELQGRSYELLQWAAWAVKSGFISFKAAHTYSSAPEAAAEWIQRHYQNIPENARPALADLTDFSGLFSTYLENSFDLASNPGQRLYSPHAHCFCSMCSWLVDAPNLMPKHLTPKHLTPQDKKRARKMTRELIRRMANEEGVYLPEPTVEAISEDSALREQLALCAYGEDLFNRMRGVAVGGAALVLWRTFAWLPSGSPKKKFKLTADMILNAEAVVRERILSSATK